MIQKQTLHLEIAAAAAAHFEERAQQLNLTPAAFLEYLLLRHEAGDDAQRLDSHIEEIFGRYGSVMRKLA